MGESPKKTISKGALDVALTAACAAGGPDGVPSASSHTANIHEVATSGSAEREDERGRMVARQLEARGIRHPRVLAAMRAVPRHAFVPETQRRFAYADHPLPIGHEQTISQPYIVALMTELSGVADRSGARVLEIGTGSGYQAAVLAAVGAEVYSIEIVEPLAARAEAVLQRLGYERVHVRAGDGYAGWPERAPFDAVLLTAAPPRIPEPLKQQLRVGGVLIAPVGVAVQELVMLTRTETGFERRTVAGVRFVPMTGRAQER